MVNLLEAEYDGGVNALVDWVGPMSSAYIRHLLVANMVSQLAIYFCSTGTCTRVVFCNCLTKPGAYSSHPQRGFRRVSTIIGMQLLEQCNQTSVR